MLAIIKTIDGVKKIVKVTADAGAGNPVGTIIPMYKKSSPSGYLYCDGSTFDETAYPLLYAYLGTNVLPDYREFALVGAEENTTSSNIADHDIYTEGQEKDDQLQEHSHSAETNDTKGNSSQDVGYMFQPSGSFIKSPSNSSQSGRAGTVTRGKRKAVYFYIKATSGLSENAQDNVINTLNEQRSYSTEEHLTGRKWIDGKDTYQAVVENITVTTNWGAITAIGNVVDSLINVIPVLTAGNVVTNVQKKVDNNYIFLAKSSSDIVESTKFIFEYTKTTDN